MSPIRVNGMAVPDNCVTQLVDRMPQNQTIIMSIEGGCGAKPHALMREYGQGEK